MQIKANIQSYAIFVEAEPGLKGLIILQRSAKTPGLNLGQDDKVPHGRSKKNATQFFLW
jgi:hypothetical protein